MGLTINRPMDIPLSRVYEQLELGHRGPSGKQLLLSGGPIGMECGFVLHPTKNQQWEATLEISPQISLTASRDIIADMASGKGPEDAIVVLGYASWGPGQLEEEIADNAWLTVPGDAQIIFHTPANERAHAAAALIGVDLNKLSGFSGHA